MFKSILHGIARMFTIPAKQRAVLNANPLAPAAKGLLAAEINTFASQMGAKYGSDAAQSNAIAVALQNAAAMTGVTK